MQMGRRMLRLTTETPLRPTGKAGEEDPWGGDCPSDASVCDGVRSWEAPSPLWALDLTPARTCCSTSWGIHEKRTKRGNEGSLGGGVCGVQSRRVCLEEHPGLSSVSPLTLHISRKKSFPIPKGSMEADFSIWAPLMSSFGGNFCVNSLPSSTPHVGTVKGGRDLGGWELPGYVLRPCRQLAVPGLSQAGLHLASGMTELEVCILWRPVGSG